VDSGVDILHPHLFFADGGAWSWLDLNGNARFDPGQDAVDLNRDGEGQPEEILRVLDATYVNFYNQESPENWDEQLQPRWDWLYADSNQDGQRNRGEAEGFEESDPAYGEPLFVADDADRDGRLELEERLIRLKTSKVREMNYNGISYRRGEEGNKALIRSTRHEGFQLSSHGTGVASILLGGQAPYHERLGLAPGAELLSFSNMSGAQEGDAEMIAFMEAAQEQGAILALHEWSDLFLAPHDGSTNLELAMDHLSAQGLSQVTPLGNMNRAQKHFEAHLKPGDDLEFSFEIDEEYWYEHPDYPNSLVLISLLWRSDQALGLHLQDPLGNEAQVPPEGAEIWLGEDLYLGAVFDHTPRGTRQLFIYIGQAEERPLPTGRWNLRIEGVEQADTLMARIGDYYSGWAVGIRWSQPVEDIRSMTHPSTADSAIGVAAYGGRHDLSELDGTRAGMLRNFSGRGPRLDGATVVDIAAPDDPFAAMAWTEENQMMGGGPSWFSTFGGTSGAGPHVAAALALLKERFPELNAQEREARILGSARQERLDPDHGALPNPHWGEGKLDIHAALFEHPAPQENQPPQLQMRLEGAPGAWIINCTSSQDPDGDPIWFRFDYDYDGRWDRDWQEEGRVTLPPAFDESAWVRVAVRDDHRGEMGGLIYLEAGPLPPQDLGVSDAGLAQDLGSSRDITLLGDLSIQQDLEQPLGEGDAGEDLEKQTSNEGCACHLSSGGSGPFFLLLLLFLLRLSRARAAPPRP